MAGVDTATARAVTGFKSLKEQAGVWNCGTAPGVVDMSELREAAKGVRYDVNVARRTDAEVNRSIREGVLQTLKGVEDILSQWAYYALAHNDHTLNTARLIVPPHTEGVVVLDATANSNAVYDVFGRSKVVRTPRARNYQSVKVHTSTGHKTGKRHLSQNADRHLKTFISSLRSSLPRTAKVLMLCHKVVEPYAAKYNDGHFAKFEVAHYGALDGRNDWRDCDAVAVFGLPFLPSTRSPNVYFALRGVQSSGWLRGETERGFETYKDIRQALDQSHVVVSVVQAINRTAMRTVIDADGNCPAVDVFMRLPGGKVCEAVLRGLRDELPKVQIVPWDDDATNKPTDKRTTKGSNYDDALVRFASNMRRGYLSASVVRQELDIQPRTWTNLTTRLKDPANDLTSKLAEVGVRYEVERRGSRNVGKLVKGAA
jgi:hypothetical protein